MGQRLGTPISGNLINCTGYVVSVNGITGLGTGVATFLGNTLPSSVTTFLGTPSSANLRAAMTDESGTGAAYFQGGDLGTPSAGNLANCTGVTLSKLTNALTGDVSLSNTANYFPGPRVAQGTTGTWLAIGKVTVLDAAGAAQFRAKLWDGATVIDSAVQTSAAAGYVISMSVCGYITSPNDDIRIDVKDFSSTSGAIKFNSSGDSKDSTLTVIRIA